MGERGVRPTIRQLYPVEKSGIRVFGVDCAIALTPIRKAIACIVLGYGSAITFFDFALANNELIQ
ncbi:hypothetical protein CEN44_09200 [Fischerella muscicola CCMEE 5323]|uniref:Uncharacterized protein n=1 Tax=Fischerella muscicola CCMEE 5323 TaxID=2019572 RepID=A0A2N6K4N4_FISMU|nr:hypothetical protein [Fischerella muscicola]MBD2431850.1 hypothetical protein [Fischerella sp. FACHB-380]PLZ91159.1 hypothetical protein CEN44_09200 [Fischerella muscicola CCMEE 5323]